MSAFGPGVPPRRGLFLFDVACCRLLPSAHQLPHIPLGWHLSRASLANIEAASGVEAQLTLALVKQELLGKGMQD